MAYAICKAPRRDEPAPRLAPVPPHAGASTRVDRSPFWIGASDDAGLPLFLPGVAARHVALVTRADGPWLVPQRGAHHLVHHNGQRVLAPLPLADGDLLELLPGVAYRVELATAPARVTVSRPFPPALPAAPAAPNGTGWRSRWRAAWQRWHRRPPRPRIATGGRVWHVAALALTAAAFLVLAVVLVVHMLRQPDASVPRSLTDAETAAYDVLTRQVADHVERGAALLESGLPEPALREFGAGVAALESSRLRHNAWVRPRIVSLEYGIAAIYRERHVATPLRYAAPRGTISTLALVSGARLDTREFAMRLAEVQSAFAVRFGRPLVITGSDHAEHLALYGARSAVDLRVRDLSLLQVAFAVDQLRAAGMRVKDFSTDAKLRSQLEAAARAGLTDRAGTGLHLHVDRFVDRTDRWTVR